MLIHQQWQKWLQLAWNCYVGRLGIDSLKTVPIQLNDLKTDLDKFDITILQTVLVDLMKPSDVVENEVVRAKSCCVLVPKLAGIK